MPNASLLQRLPLARAGEARQREQVTDPDRAALEQRWLHLTRSVLPSLAIARSWPVRADHCFARILLDNACEGRWYDHIAGRPAYRHADWFLLERAIALGESAIDGSADLHSLNDRSLGWRGKRPGQGSSTVSRASASVAG